jgi:hypothetical protein
MSNGVKRKWLYFFSLLIFFAGAISIFTSLTQSGRSPAAIPSAFSWQDIENKQRKQILAVTEILKQDSQFLLHIGDTVEASMCNRYQNVKVEFTAEGMAVSGNKPTLTFSTKCTKTDAAISMLIPIEEISSKTAGDYHFAFTANPQVSVKVEHVIGFWPDNWSLSQITFYNEPEGQKFSVSRDHLREKVISLHFPEP